MPKQKSKHSQSKRSLMIAIEVASILLLVLIALAVVLSRNKNAPVDNNSAQSGQQTVSTNPSDTTKPGTNGEQQPTDTTQKPVDNVPTESAPLPLEQGLYVVHVGSFTGKYVEDLSDDHVENCCAVIVENRSERTLQLLQFEVVAGDRVYDFSLTTLPPGERAIVQERNRVSYTPSDAVMVTNVELCSFFPEEPSLYEETFAVTGSEYGIELRNLTDADIPGPIYVYYKTRTADGYGGGITYRITVPGLEANAIYNASVSHFWPGSSQVMFINYVQ